MNEKLLHVFVYRRPRKQNTVSTETLRNMPEFKLTCGLFIEYVYSFR